ncbi:MAG: hypothetical protein OEL53_00545 [Rhodospirillales bacterium]|nr:hypothetical protein [Rhodospirillales bacterium]
MPQISIEVKGEDLPAKVLRRLGVSPRSTVRLSAEVNPNEDPPLSEDMDIQDFTRVMAVRMKARGLTADDIAESLEMSDEERHNLLEA